MLQAFIDHVTRQHLFPTGQEVLAAVSGGQDSTVLAHLMHLAGYPFAIAHCNFHLRGADSDRDEQFVRTLAETYGVTVHVAQFDTQAYARIHHEGIEEAARHLRYQWFADLCRQYGYPAVLVAHHADDVAETVLFNLIRGTGIAGLHGIRPVVSFDNDSCRIVRPLLPFTRADILRYHADNHLSFVADTTNLSTQYGRNYLRLQIMPELNAKYGNASQGILTTAQNLHGVEELYDYLLEPLRQRYLHAQLDGSHKLDFAALRRDVPPYLQRQLLFEILRPYGFSGSQVDTILSLKTSGRTLSSATHYLLYHHGDLVIVPLAILHPPTVDAEVHFTVTPVAVPRHLPLPYDPTTVILDADTFRQPLQMRPWRAGDRFQPIGMTHGTKLISDYLTDLKLSLFDKQRQKLLVDADDQILWVVGRRIAHPCRITAATRRAVQVTIS